MAVTLVFYSNQKGREPFEQWLAAIGDRKTEGIIRARLRRIEEYGNLRDLRTLGDYKRLKGTDGMFEFRIDHGPGYRIYWGIIGEDTILLLRGGIRRNQRRDLRAAKADWEEHNSRS